MGKVSLVLPVYNEQIILRDVLAKYVADLENIRLKLDYDWEVVAVDDCSADESKLILMDYAKKYRQFKVVSLAQRSGKHAAVTAGFSVATGDLIITTEIDLQNPMGLLQSLVQEHLESKVSIIYGYQQFTGWQKRRAFFTDRLTRMACRMFLLPGYFTGIVNAELYTADVADVLRQNPAKNKYMRTMNNWVGWESKEYWYAREYSDAEIQAKKEELRRRNRHVTNFKNHGHVASNSNWYGVLCLFLAALSFGLAFSALPGQNAVFLGLTFTLAFAFLTVAVLFFFRALLLRRIGNINYRPGEIIYEIKSILNK